MLIAAHSVRRVCSSLVVLCACAAPLSWSAPSAAQVGEGAGQPRDIGQPVDVCLTNSPAIIRTQNGQYSFAPDGVNFSDPRPASTVVRLRYAEFDPLGGAGEPPMGEMFQAPRGDEPDAQRVYIVQFIVPPLQPLLDEVRAAGALPLAYLADQCFITRMTPATRDVVSQLPHVRWIGEYHPAYRLEEELLAALAAQPNLPALRCSIQLFERGVIPQQRVAQAIVQIGGAVTLTTQAFRMEAVLTGAQILQVARLNDVLFIDRKGEPSEDMDNARQIGGAVPILSNVPFTGQGVRAEVMDGGVRTTHDALEPVLLHGPNGTSLGHGTNTTGCVFGSGAANPTGTGMLPAREQIIFAAYGQLDDRYQHTAELVDPAGPYRAVFQSNSWGDPQITSYSTISAEMDTLLFDHDILICQSQSNTGSQTSRPQAWAKNIVSVGGIRHQNTLSRADDTWTAASFGPAADGRIKPDLAHFYDNVMCTSSSNDTSYTMTFSGTSAATPITAGHFGLLFQMWHEGVFPGFGGASTVFESRPHMTTAKALMINTAFKYNWLAGGPNGNLTRVKQGWGMADVGRLYNEAESLLIINETSPVTPLGTNAHEVQVPAGQAEFRATMTYRDPGGTTSSTIHRINDLSLRVTAPNGNVYWGNNGLSAGNTSTPGGASNTVDTVENVFVSAPEAGTWTVEVLGNLIVQDGHVATPQLDAAYALVVTGLPGGEVIGDVDGDGDVDVDDLVAVILAWGPCPAPPAACPADVYPQPGGDGQVDSDDLTLVILNWS
jgi:hypothetical protein